MLALMNINSRQIVQEGRHIGVIWPKGFFPYCQCPLIKGLSLVMLALMNINSRQIVQ